MGNKGNKRAIQGKVSNLWKETRFKDFPSARTDKEPTEAAAAAMVSTALAAPQP